MTKFKDFTEPIPNHDNNSVYTQPRPATCPHCGVAISPQVVSWTALRSNKTLYFFFCLKCPDPDCGQNIHCVYSQIPDIRALKLLVMSPNFSTRKFDKHIEDLSPRFVQMYKEAFTSEQNGHLNLASIGYRSAVEFLVKDYAINYLKTPEGEVISKNFEKSIKTYLPEARMSQSADVVRIMGNDKTHYNQILDLDFSVLKEYLEILIHFVSINIKAGNPPVKRKG